MPLPSGAARGSPGSSGSRAAPLMGRQFYDKKLIFESNLKVLRPHLSIFVNICKFFKDACFFSFFD